jgi:hypothetical protein
MTFKMDTFVIRCERLIMKSAQHGQVKMIKQALVE